MRDRRHLLHLQLVTEDHRLQLTGHPQAPRATPAAALQALRVTPAAALQALRATPVAVRHHPPATPGGALHPGTLAAEHPEVAVIAEAQEDNKHLRHKKI